MVTYWIWQVDRVQAFTFLFHHKLNRLDGRASSVVLVVSPTKACILGRVGRRSKTTLFFTAYIHCTWPAGAGAATWAERE